MFLPGAVRPPLVPADLASTAACTNAWTLRRCRPGKPGASPVAGRASRGWPSVIAVYLAAFRDYADVLSVGRGRHAAGSGSRPASGPDLHEYISGLLDEHRMFAALVVGHADTRRAVDRRAHRIHTASWRALRGYTVVGCVLDEVCFWRSEDSSNPDHEIVNAVRPAMVTVPHSCWWRSALPTVGGAWPGTCSSATTVRRATRDPDVAGGVEGTVLGYQFAPPLAVRCCARHRLPGHGWPTRSMCPTGDQRAHRRSCSVHPARHGLFRDGPSGPRALRATRRESGCCRRVFANAVRDARSVNGKFAQIASLSLPVHHSSPRSTFPRWPWSRSHMTDISACTQCRLQVLGAAASGCALQAAPRQPHHFSPSDLSSSGPPGRYE